MQRREDSWLAEITHAELPRDLEAVWRLWLEHLLLALECDAAIGIACLRRIGPDTAEIERM